MYRRHTSLILALAIACLLGACGFQLRGTGSEGAALPDAWKKMHMVTGNPNAEFSQAVRQVFATDGIEWTSRADAGYSLVLGPERFSQSNLSLNAEARVSQLELTLQSKFSVVDASGRAGLLKRQLGLARGNGHAAFSVWFRVRGHVRPDDWGQVGAGDPAAWRTRCGVGQRWLSTNHLCGPGYWVWLIPLASGCHSVGIVADPAQHDFEAMKTHAGAMRWLARHQPQLHAALAASAEPPLDFGFLRSFSHDARQLFSHQRWALVGEAGRFLDPFYSPGSDFIAIGNTYVTELVGIDLGGGDLRPAARLFDAVFRSFYDNMLPLYEGQYALFGNAAAMSHKVVWDYTYYWSVLAPLFFHGRLADTALLAECAAPMQACAQLNQGMQDWLRAAAEQRGERLPRAPAFQDHTQIHWFRTLNTRLTQPAARADVARQMHEAPQVMATRSGTGLGRSMPASHWAPVRRWRSSPVLPW